MKSYFEEALPIWKSNAESEHNLYMGFRTQTEGTGNCQVVLACSDAYQLFVNGRFVAAGPARTAKGYFRVDGIDVSNFLESAINYISIIVCAYNAASYQYAINSGFLTCEIKKNNKIIAATGIKGFVSGICTEYIRETDRFSFQRQFAEVKKSYTENGSWKTGAAFSECEVSIQKKKAFLVRNVRYPMYERLMPKVAENCYKLTVEGSVTRTKLWDMDLRNTDYFYYSNPAENLLYDIQKIKYTDNIAYSGENNFIPADSYRTYELDHNSTGFVSLEVCCKDETVLYVLFDETLTNNKIDSLRLGCTNALKFYLSAGKHSVVSFEPNTMKYFNICTLGTDVEILNAEFIEYKHPKVQREFECKNNKIKKIYDAAVETFRQNALDIYMDCPSRERAGWLCDSFFTARAEQFLCGENLVEESFLENFLLPEKVDYIPDGMIPMCYPAEHVNGNYIPNWAMWLVLQLYDYNHRTKKKGLVEKFKDKIYKLVKFFEKYENSEGLIENLDKWVFVDWSVANEYTKGINFPSNMMYAYMLECTGMMYSDTQLIEKSKRIKSMIRKLSYNGEFFVDNLEESIDCSKNISEACQYYAFFTKTADKQSYPELWQKIINELGPNMQDGVAIGKANAFIGNYLRLAILEREEEWELILNEIVEYFYYMAERTGTLWEKIDTGASLNHGFASYAAVLIYKAVTSCNNVKKS